MIDRARLEQIDFDLMRKDLCPECRDLYIFCRCGEDETYIDTEGKWY